MNQEKINYTLITGASLGIGKSLAFECAKRNMNLLLVALPGQQLLNLTNSLRRIYPIAVDCLGIDLTEDNACQKVYDWCMQKGYSVNILINNAGLGTSGLFEKIKLDYYQTMMKLNNQVLVGLTYKFLPELKKHASAYILNLSSMEAMLPLPYKSVYTGTKNFTYAFSLALREELKSDNVSVSVLCPGPTITNKEGLVRIKTQGKKSRLIVLLPRHVARIAIYKMLQGKGIIVPGRMNILLARISRIIPTATKMRILENMFRAYRTHAS